MNPTPSEQVKNFNDCLEFIKLGVAGPDDFELVGGKIMKGVRVGAASGTIVKPADGHAFIPLRIFDAREFKLVPGPPNEYMVVKTFPPREISVAAKFVVSNDNDEQIVNQGLAALKSLPGYTE